MSSKFALFALTSLAASSALGGTAMAVPPWTLGNTMEMCVLHNNGQGDYYTVEEVRIDKADWVYRHGGFFFFSPAYNDDCTLGPIWDLCVMVFDLDMNVVDYHQAGLSQDGDFIGFAPDGSAYPTSAQLITYCPE